MAETDLRVTKVLYLLSCACRTVYFSWLILCSSDLPCKIEEVPAVDAIVLSACPIFAHTAVSNDDVSASTTIMISTYDLPAI